MFCENCGMEMEKTRFCPGCGAEQKSVVSVSASIPVSEAVSSTPAASVPAESVPAPEAASSIPAASVPAGSVPAPEAASSIPAAASVPAGSVPVSTIPTAPAAPQPSVIPNNGVSATVIPMGVTSSPTVVVTDESKLKTPERRYTGGHIALCLITAAVMAGIAGMFAGLYFSLLWAIG